MVTRVLSLIDLLQQAAARGASDLHIAAGFPPTFRVGGELVAAELPALWADDTAHLIGELLIESGFGDQFERFLTDHTEIDCGLTLDGAGRVRANIHLAQRAVAGAFRLVRGYVPTVGELGLPEVALPLVQRPAGLLIITGPTGHGKTTSQTAPLQGARAEDAPADPHHRGPDRVAAGQRRLHRPPSDRGLLASGPVPAPHA